MAWPFPFSDFAKCSKLPISILVDIPEQMRTSKKTSFVYSLGVGLLEKIKISDEAVTIKI